MLIVLVSLFYSCVDVEKGVVNSYNQQPILNIGHAGSGFNYLLMPFNPYPTNSMTSLKRALENGAAGVEVDLQISSDSVLILYHDLTLESNTNLKGLIPFTSGKEIIGTNYICGFPYDLFQDEQVISLNDWLNYAVTLPEIPHLHIDFKVSEGQPDSSIITMIRKLNEDLINARYPMEKVIVISLSKIILQHLNNTNPDFILALESNEPEEGIKWAIENNCDYLIFNPRDLTAELIDSVHSNGMGVIAIGGKSKSTLTKIINMKPVFIQSNNVKLLDKLLN